MANTCRDCKHFSLDNIRALTGHCAYLSYEITAYDEPCCNCFEAKHPHEVFPFGISIKPCPLCGKEVKFSYITKSAECCIEFKISCASCSLNVIGNTQMSGATHELLSNIAAFVSKWNTRNR